MFSMQTKYLVLNNLVWGKNILHANEIFDFTLRIYLVNQIFGFMLISLRLNT